MNVYCPQCKGTDVALDWKSVTAIRITNDKVEYVHHGGILGVDPDHIFCYDCHQESAIPVGMRLEYRKLLDGQLPYATKLGLLDGLTIWRSK